MVTLALPLSRAIPGRIKSKYAAVHASHDDGRRRVLGIMAVIPSRHPHAQRGAIWASTLSQVWVEFRGQIDAKGNPRHRRRLVAGVDLNHRPLGYENGRLPLSAVESIAPKAKLSCQNRFCQPKCWRLLGVGTTKVWRLNRYRIERVWTTQKNLADTLSETPRIGHRLVSESGGF